MRIYGPDKKFFSLGFPQAKRCKNIEVSQFPRVYGKLPKNFVKFGCGSPGILVNFLAGQENHPTFNIYGHYDQWSLTMTLKSCKEAHDAATVPGNIHISHPILATWQEFPFHPHNIVYIIT